MTTLRVKSVDVSPAQAKVKKAEKAMIKAMTLAARRDSNRYVPFASGALRNTAESQSKPDDGQLIYGGGGVKYARVQYYGKFRHTTPGTCGKWFDAAKKSNAKKWVKEGKEAVRQVMNG